jgi:hypothetical protein
MQLVEQLVLFLALTQRIPHFPLFYFFELEPHILEELTEVAHRSAPFVRESLTLLAQEGKAPLQCGPQAQAMEIEDARGESSAQTLRAAVDYDRVTRPDRAVAEAQLERFEQAARGERHVRRGSGPEPGGAQVEDAERADENAVAPEAANEVGGNVGGVETRRPESDTRAVRADQVFVSRGGRA